MPTKSSQYPGSSLWGSIDVNDQASSDVQWRNINSSKMAGGSYQSYTNWLTFSNKNDIPNLDQYITNNGRALGVRAEYNMGIQGNPYPSAPWSIPTDSPAVKNQDWNYSTMLGKGYNPNHPYEAYLN